MTSERIKEIQEETAYPNSVSVQQALLKVWNECVQEPKQETLEEAAEEYSEEYFNRDEIQMRCSKISFIDGYKLAQEQILDFLHLEITERRDYSASKMCEKVVEFIEQFKNK